MKRALVLLVILIALLLAACGGDEKVNPPEVQLQVSGQTFAEDVYSYCWPVSADNWECDVDEMALAKPAHQATIGKDDDVKFVVPGNEGSIERITAQVIGVSDEQDLGSGPEVAFDPQLADGVHRIQINVEYASVEGVELAAGEKPYVSYVFGVQVAGVLTPTPTPTNTPLPTDTPTPTQTPEPTATSTLTPTIPPTNTPEPTETPLPTPTETPLPESTTSGADAGGDLTTALGDVALTGVVQLADATGAAQPGEGIQVRYSYRSTVNTDQPDSGATLTNANGEFAFDPMTIYADDVLVVIAEAPGYELQAMTHSGADVIAANGVYDFTLQPAGPTSDTDTSTDSDTDTATPAPTMAQPIPTATPIPVSTAMPDVPPLNLDMAGRVFSPTGYQLCERTENGERLCVERPYENATGRIDLPRGVDVQIQIGGERPNEVEIEYLNDLGVRTGQPETRPGDSRLLLTITPEAGSYIMVIRVIWDEYDAVYFFRITVSD
ncbi:MAG: hypothetical protein JXA10_19200 [Anaerolineae bacterium]|nr:hypothetical protein [Anaerolineae bacterium]